jgi:hypothetical protein
MKKLTIEHVSKVFADGGCKLLEGTYKDCETPMKYQCNCGGIANMSYANFKKGKRCKTCSGKKNGLNKRFSYEYVYNYFLEHGCKLLSNEYFKNNDLLKYICNCGEESIITFHHFRYGGRCWKCGVSKRSGKNHHKWHSDRDDAKRLKFIKKRFYKLVYNCRQSFQCGKMFSSKHMLGYSPEELDNYIRNHPNYEYTINKIKMTGDKESIDHIFPISAFSEYNLDKEEYIWLVNSLDNLRPMPFRENCSKSDTYDKNKFKEWLLHKGIVI